jgi:hypothetical protein
MVKTATQRSWGQRPGIGANILPGLDPATFAANLEQFFHAGSKVMDHWRQVSDELCEFGKSLLKRNMEVGHKVTRCGSVDEALEAQTDFARTMVQDYIAESGKLAEMSTRAIFEGLSAWKALAARVEGEEATKHSMAAE